MESVSDDDWLILVCELKRVTKIQSFSSISYSSDMIAFHNFVAWFLFVSHYGFVIILNKCGAAKTQDGEENVALDIYIEQRGEKINGINTEISHRIGIYHF